MYEANVAYTNTDIEISEQLKSGRRLKNKAAIQLLQTWLEDDSVYDEEVWSRAKKQLRITGCL